MITKHFLQSTIVIIFCIVLYPLKLSLGTSSFSLSYFGVLFLAFYYFYKFNFRLDVVVGKWVLFFTFYLMIQILIFGFNSNSVVQFSLILSSVFSALYVYKKFSLEVFYYSYYRVALFLCLFSIVQAFAYLININWVYDLSWLYPEYSFRLTGNQGLPRFHSVFPEPAHFIQFLSPLIYWVFFLEYEGKERVSLLSKFVIALACMISMSSMFVIVIVICVLLKLITEGKFHKNIFLLLTSFIFVFLLYTYVDDFNSRIKPFFQFFIDDNFVLDDSLNFSSFTLLNNLNVAIESFVNSFAIGSGLGSHQSSYMLYSATNFIDNIPELNKEDANSLFIRGISELGLMSIVFFYMVTHKVIMMGKQELSIKAPLLVFILVYFLRMGNYSAYGFWFFLIYLLMLSERHDSC